VQLPFRKKPKERPVYYDVERFKRIYVETLRKNKGFRKFLGRASEAFLSVEGVWVAMLAPVITLGTVALVVLSSAYGVFGVLGSLALLIGGLTLLLEKKVGSSITVGDYPLLKKMAATTVAFALALGLFFLLLVLLPLVTPLGRVFS